MSEVDLIVGHRYSVPLADGTSGTVRVIAVLSGVAKEGDTAGTLSDTKVAVVRLDSTGSHMFVDVDEFKRQADHRDTRTQS